MLILGSDRQQDMNDMEKLEESIGMEGRVGEKSEAQNQQRSLFHTIIMILLEEKGSKVCYSVQRFRVGSVIYLKMV